MRNISTVHRPMPHDRQALDDRIVTLIRRICARLGTSPASCAARSFSAAVTPDSPAARRASSDVLRMLAAVSGPPPAAPAPGRRSSRRPSLSCWTRSLREDLEDAGRALHVERKRADDAHQLTEDRVGAPQRADRGPAVNRCSGHGPPRTGSHRRGAFDGEHPRLRVHTAAGEKPPTSPPAPTTHGRGTTTNGLRERLPDRARVVG